MGKKCSMHDLRENMKFFHINKLSFNIFETEFQIETVVRVSGEEKRSKLLLIG